MSLFFTKEVYEGSVSYSPTLMGYVLFVVVLLLLLTGISLITIKGKKNVDVASKQTKKNGVRSGVRRLAFSAMAIALAIVMSFLKLVELPMGGSLTLCSMLFITLIGYWFGLKTGLLTAVAYGVLQLIIGPYIITPLQLVTDYFLAFGALGLSGIFSNIKGGLILGYWTGVFGRFIFAFLSGMIFFGAYASDYGMSAPVYSALYNGAYIFAEAVLTTAILVIPPVNKALIKIKRMVETD